MLLTHNGSRFELQCLRSESALPSFHGFNWDGKAWWTGQTAVAVHFLTFADDSAKAILTKQQIEIIASRATDANIEIPVPKGLAYLPFQKAGIAYILKKFQAAADNGGYQATGNVLLGDEMGLGKTIQTCGVINSDPSINSVLVICPASLKLNWHIEMQRWLVRPTTIGIADSTKTFPRSSIVILNYDIVKKFIEDINLRRWDLLVCDECSAIKNPKAQRTKYILGYSFRRKILNAPIQSPRRLFLSGTPILNRPVELWPILHVADPGGLGANYYKFTKRYCGAWKAPWLRGGYDVNGHSNLAELQASLREKLMVRRMKKDVLAELPPKRRQIITLPADAVKKVIETEREFYEKNSATISEAVKEVAKAQARGDNKSYKAASKRMQEAQSVLFEQMSVLRHQTAVAKIPFAIEFIEEVLEQEDKIVVFAHHVDVILALKAKFKDIAVVYYGDTTLIDRQKAVNLFQQDKKIKLFLGGMTAAGMGITLTAASYALFLELDWRPSIVNQCEDRLHRIGQIESVLIQHLLFDGSLDSRMVKEIISKQEVISKALDD